MYPLYLFQRVFKMKALMGKFQPWILCGIMENKNPLNKNTWRPVSPKGGWYEPGESCPLKNTNSM